MYSFLLIPNESILNLKRAIPGLFFLYFRLYNTVDSKQMFDKSLPMTGFEPRFSGVGGDPYTTTSAVLFI